MRSRAILRVVIILSSLLCLSSGTYAEDAAGKAKIGIILSLTGDLSSWGTTIQKAMLFAQANLPANNRLELLFEDDASQPKNTVTALQRLMARNKLAAVITASSGTSKAISPLVDANRIPLLAIATDPEVVRGKKYVVNFWVTPETEAALLVPEALKRGYKKIARITSNHPGTISMSNAFEGENKGQLEIVLDEEIGPEERDFRAFIAKLRKRNPDAIFANLLPGQNGIFAKQVREAGLQLPIFAVEVFEDREEVKASEGALIGQWYVSADDPSGDFYERFLKQHPNSSLFATPNAYDAIFLLAEAANTGIDPESINRFLHTVKDFTGVLGSFSATGDNRFSLKAAIKVVTETGFKKLY